MTTATLPEPAAPANGAASAYTQAERLLLAALRLEDRGERPFDASALILEAWKGSPRQFGLKGFEESYPDSNRVIVALAVRHGPVHTGAFAMMGPKRYQLTPDGRAVAEELAQSQSNRAAAHAPAVSARLAAATKQLLSRLLAARAPGLVREDRRPELSFADATEFWGLAEEDVGQRVTPRLAAVQQGIARADAQLVGRVELELDGGLVVTAEDLDLLCRTHAYLSARFARHLSLLRSR